MPKRQRESTDSEEPEDPSDKGWTPRRKKKRQVKRQKQLLNVPAARKTSLPQQRGENANNLATLPDELLVEILSHLPVVPLPTTEYVAQDAKAHRLRQQALMALSFTCSNFRRFFRSYAWDRIEVVTPKGRSSNLELLRQLEMVTIRGPSLAQFVKVINVHIRYYSAMSVVDELARCLEIFPNLHFVRLQMPAKLDEYPFGYEPEVRKVFSTRCYPQIRSVIVSKAACDLIPSCPQIRMARSIEGRQNTLPFLYAIRNCRHLEDLEMDIDDFNVTAFVTSCPNLHSISLFFFTLASDHSQVYEYKLPEFSGLKHLSHLVLHVGPFHTPQAKAFLLDWAKALLLELQRADGQEKCLEVIGQEGHPDWPKIEDVKIIFPAVKRRPAVGI